MQFKSILIPDDKGNKMKEAMQVKYKSTTQDNYGDACDKK